MRKLASILIVLLVCLGISGCNNLRDESGTYSGYKVSSKHGTKIFNMDGYEVPVALGFPNISKESATSIYDAELQQHVHNYADLLMYLDNKTFSEDDDLAERYVGLIARLYDEAGLITIMHTDGMDKMIYVKQDNIYFPLDINHQAKTEKLWLDGYKNNKLCSEDKTEFCDNIMKSYPYLNKEDIYVVKTNLSLPDDDCHPVYSESGVPFKSYFEKGAELIEWDGFLVPAGFGFPEYTHNEIQQMVDDPDKTMVAKKIHTVADALSYYTRAKFIEDEGPEQKIGSANVLDVGNVIYNDTPFAWYSVSGLEQLSLKRSQCSGASTLFNYLLWGDYDDLGYVTIPGHCFMYIKGHDDKYYLFDPSDYIYHSDYGKNIVTPYLPHYRHNKICGDSLEELMEYLVESGYHGLSSIFTLSYDGVMAYQHDTSQDVFNPRCRRLFPKGSTAKCWLGDIDFRYIDFEHSTSQEYIMGVE